MQPRHKLGLDGLHAKPNIVVTDAPALHRASRNEGLETGPEWQRSGAQGPQARAEATHTPEGVRDMIQSVRASVPEIRRCGGNCLQVQC